jgi:hypothetical protein
LIRDKEKEKGEKDKKGNKRKRGEKREDKDKDRNINTRTAYKRNLSAVNSTSPNKPKEKKMLQACGS